MDARRDQAQELKRQCEWTLARAVDPREALPMLHRLARVAQAGSEEHVFASQHLAELLVERDPWRAALHARRVVAQRPNDDRGWATLALCQTLLGNYKCAASAYKRALARSPDNPWYAHNLGHLLDVALGRAGEAVAWLKRAFERAPQSGDVAASYAHALARAGDLREARRVLARASRRGASREHAALLRWLEQGAPAGEEHALPRRTRCFASAFASASEAAASMRHAARSSRRALRPARAADLDETLARGLANLPLDAKQRARAKSLARDALAILSRKAAIAPLAAAVAYAIVYVDHVPLTQSEVAACFRVTAASLRARFAELRAHLDLTPGDARYATQRK